MAKAGQTSTKKPPASFDELEFKTHLGGAAMGTQAQATFPNGYGVSVVCEPYSYGGPQGLYELAVRGPDGNLDYTTPITGDVEGHLSPERVTELLQAIAALPAKGA